MVFSVGNEDSSGAIRFLKFHKVQKLFTFTYFISHITSKNKVSPPYCKSNTQYVQKLQ